MCIETVVAASVWYSAGGLRCRHSILCHALVGSLSIVGHANEMLAASTTFALEHMATLQ